MEIMIDGHSVNDIKEDCKTIGELVELIRSALKGSGKMIIAIKCNDQIVKPEEVENVLGKSLEEYDKIEFQTASPASLAQDALRASKEMLEGAKGQISKLIDNLQQSQIQEAMEQMGTTFQQLNNAYQGIDGCLRLLKIEPESIELSGINADRLFKKVTGNLQDIKEALSNRDYVQLADLLSYELMPTIDNFEELIDVLLHNIESEGTESECKDASSNNSNKEE